MKLTTMASTRPRGSEGVYHAANWIASYSLGVDARESGGT